MHNITPVQKQGRVTPLYTRCVKLPSVKPQRNVISVNAISHDLTRLKMIKGVQSDQRCRNCLQADRRDHLENHTGHEYLPKVQRGKYHNIHKIHFMTFMLTLPRENSHDNKNVRTRSSTSIFSYTLS